ncbi:MAG: prepilin-type N-terminal cleavage/methylation domain-containing protein [Candidatus Omnitrophota bacterium]
MRLLNRGFTLVEVLLAAGILALCLCGLLAAYVNLFFLSDLSRDMTLANNAMQAKMEELKKTNFDALSSFNGTVFDIAGFSASLAKGAVFVTDTGYSELKEARIVVSFKSRGRLIGEDTNLNGQLNSGEDLNANNRLDSPVESVTLIAK